MNAEPIDVEVVEDEVGEKATTAALARVEPNRLDIIRPIASTEIARQAFAEYQQLRKTVITPDDTQAIGGKEFVKKAGWRKLAVIMGVSVEIVSRHYERDLAGRIANAEVVVRATAPNGRFMDGLGLCDYRERCCPKAYGEPCNDKRSYHHHCDEGCRGFPHFSKPQHDIPATANTRATNRACSDLFGFGEVSAEEVGDRGEPVDDEKVNAIKAALNSIESKEARAIVKTKFKEQFGLPDGLTNGDMPAVERWLTANGLTLPDVDPPSGGGERGPEGSRTAPESAPPPASPGPDSGTEGPEGTSAVPPEPSNPQGGRPTPSALRESTTQQRRSAGIIVSQLEKAEKLQPGDKAEIVGILTGDRTSTTTETTYDEMVKVIACLRFIENGALAMENLPDGRRGVRAKTAQGTAWVNGLKASQTADA